MLNPFRKYQVVDGDTIRAEAKGKEIKIRLVEIDAPEMNQPFGAQSKNFLNRLLYEKDVTLHCSRRRSLWKSSR